MLRISSGGLDGRGNLEAHWEADNADCEEWKSRSRGTTFQQPAEYSLATLHIFGCPALFTCLRVLSQRCLEVTHSSTMGRSTTKPYSLTTADLQLIHKLKDVFFQHRKAKNTGGMDETIQSGVAAVMKANGLEAKNEARVTRVCFLMYTTML